MSASKWFQPPSRDELVDSRSALAYFLYSTRKHLGHTQLSLAQLFDLSWITVSRWERGLLPSAYVAQWEAWRELTDETSLVRGVRGAAESATRRCDHRFFSLLLYLLEGLLKTSS